MSENTDNVLNVDISSLDPELRLELGAQLKRFSMGMTPQFAKMLSAEMTNQLNLAAEETGTVDIDLTPLDENLREELRERFNAFSANLSPNLAEFLIGSVESTIDQLRSEDDTS